MAIYHLSLKRISRGDGRSAVGAAAYRAGVKLHNEHDGITHDYTKRRGVVASAAYRAGARLNDGDATHDFTAKKDVVYSGIMLPPHAPREFFDRETFWNSVEKIERNKNARLACEIVTALPNELNTEQQIKLAQDFIKRNLVDMGICVDFSIHAGKHEHKNGEEMAHDDAIKRDNPHVHIMLTVRPINADGTWGAKSRKEYILDKNGDKIRLPSGEWKSRKVSTTDWEETETLIKWRKDWADTVNREFERLGIDERIDHRSLKEQGIDREPTIHLGAKAYALEKQGIRTRLGDINREIIARNQARAREVEAEITAENLHELEQKYIAVASEIGATKREIGDIERERRDMLFKMEDIAERAGRIQELHERIGKLATERQEIGFFSFKRKKEIDDQLITAQHLHEQAKNHGNLISGKH